VLFELATEGPGFVFESPDRLGESLVLVSDGEDGKSWSSGFRCFSNTPLANPVNDRSRIA